MIKEKIAQEVKNAIMPEMEKIMINANNTAKESQKHFLNQVSAKLEEWEKEWEKMILEKVDQQVKKSLDKHESY